MPLINFLLFTIQSHLLLSFFFLNLILLQFYLKLFVFIVSKLLHKTKHKQAKGNALMDYIAEEVKDDPCVTTVTLITDIGTVMLMWLQQYIT